AAFKAKNEEVKEKLAKFLLMVGRGQESAADKPHQMSTTGNTQPKKVADKSAITQIIQAEILSKQKIPKLADFCPEALSVLDDEHHCPQFRLKKSSKKNPRKTTLQQLYLAAFSNKKPPK
ncbi:1793_t:CDS:2, partial [Entrophospora sp. SA101]